MTVNNATFTAALGESFSVLNQLKPHYANTGVDFGALLNAVQDQYRDLHEQAPAYTNKVAQNTADFAAILMGAGAQNSGPAGGRGA